jgi:hypothetical protein
MLYEDGIDDSDHATGSVLLVVKMKYEQVQGSPASSRSYPPAAVSSI